MDPQIHKIIKGNQFLILANSLCIHYFCNQPNQHHGETNQSVGSKGFSRHLSVNSPTLHTTKNEAENRDAMDGFSSTYVSNTTSCVAYMECDDDFEKSLVSMKMKARSVVKCDSLARHQLLHFSNM